MTDILKDRHLELVEKASNFLIDHHEHGRHHVACALDCGNKIYYALHLDVKGFDVCAEPIAISNAMLEHEKIFKTIVSVGLDHKGKTEIVNPCGNCRQIFLQYCPDIEVVVIGKQRITEVIKAPKLLPDPYN